MMSSTATGPREERWRDGMRMPARSGRGGLGADRPAVGLVAHVPGGPVIDYLALGDRAARVLEELKAWLSQNNAAVMAVLLLVFGVVLLGRESAG